MYFIPRLDHNKWLGMEIQRLEYRKLNLMEIVWQKFLLMYADDIFFLSKILWLWISKSNNLSEQYFLN